MISLPPSGLSAVHTERSAETFQWPRRVGCRADGCVRGCSSIHRSIAYGRFFTRPEVEHRRRVVVLGYNPYETLFEKRGLDPIGKKVKIGAIEFTVVGVHLKSGNPREPG